MATLWVGPRGDASFTTLSAFRAAFNKRPSPRLQFLLEGLNELHGFKIGMNDHGVLIQVAPRQHGNSVKLVLPLHIAALAFVFKDPGGRQFRSPPSGRARILWQVKAVFRNGEACRRQGKSHAFFAIKRQCIGHLGRLTERGVPAVFHSAHDLRERVQ